MPTRPLLQAAVALGVTLMVAILVQSAYSVSQLDYVAALYWCEEVGSAPRGADVLEAGWRGFPWWE